MKISGKNKKIKNINLILPKNFVNPNLKKNRHLYFLSGPIRGAGDWQKNAVKMLADEDRDCYIVCPCRYSKRHELYNFSLSSKYKKPFGGSGVAAKKFSSQTLWERYYLELASYYGSIIFWLPLECKDNPRRKNDGPYARETLGEIGRWSVRSAYKLGLGANNKNKEKVNMIIGIQRGFSGRKTIKRNLDADHGKNYPIYASLKETINKAISLAKKSSKNIK